jgi:hypothetical protein
VFSGRFFRRTSGKRAICIISSLHISQHESAPSNVRGNSSRWL